MTGFKSISFRLPRYTLTVCVCLFFLLTTSMLASSEGPRYFVGVCSGVYGTTSYRTQFELVNEETYSIDGQLSFFRSDGNQTELKLRSIWSGDSGSLETIEGVTEFSIPGKSTLIILTVPEPDRGLGWAKLQTNGPLFAQAALQTAKTDFTKKTDDFDQTIQYQAELQPVSPSKKIAFPISLYAGMKHLSTAFTVVNLSGSNAKVKMTFRPDVTREIELEPGELLADYFERFWPLSFPAIFPFQLRGNAEISSDAPLAVGVFRTINGFPDLGIRIATPASTEDREPVEIGLDTEFNLQIGQVVKVSETDLSIELWDIAEDSRCPVDVVCVWEGRVVADLRVSSAGEENRSVQLSTQPESNSSVFGDYRITLVKVEPAPISTNRIEIADYILRLKVTKVD